MNYRSQYRYQINKITEIEGLKYLINTLDVGLTYRGFLKQLENKLPEEDEE